MAKAKPKAKPKAKKKVIKKVAKKPAAKPIGKVTHFFDKISVGIIKLSAPMKKGDKIKFEGHGKSFTQTVSSMQINYEKIVTAKKGQEIGMKVNKPVKEGDLVYKA